MMDRCRAVRTVLLCVAALGLQLGYTSAVAAPTSVGEQRDSAAPATDLDPARQDELRVCADPNNMPFSNAAGEGLENRLADLLGTALHEKVVYTWWAQRRGFLRNTLDAGKCDVVMGLPAGSKDVATTRPYYASRFVMVYRRDRGYHIASLDDERLARLRIGIHLIGSESTPPALMLARRGLTANVVGYSIFGDYRQPNPSAGLIDAVATGAIDVAVVWGPLAGYFAPREPVALEIVPLPDGAATATTGDSAASLFALPMRFAIAIAVRKSDDALRQKLDAVLQQEQPEITALLTAYGVPMANGATAAKNLR